MTPVLGYWNIRGLGQSIRLMLTYTESDFVDKHYACGPPPDFDRSAWLKEKYRLGLDFPNLPYYIDDKIKLTQSIAIMHYLARKHKLDPETEEDRIRTDLIEQQIYDIEMGFANVCHSPEFEMLKDEYLKQLSVIFEQLSKFLDNRNWFASQDKLTYVDFAVYETLDHLKTLAPERLDDFQNLKDFMQRFENLPTLKKYIQSNETMKFPPNGDNAYFGSRHTKK